MKCWLLSSLFPCPHPRPLSLCGLSSQLDSSVKQGGVTHARDESPPSLFSPHTHAACVHALELTLPSDPCSRCPIPTNDAWMQECKKDAWIRCVHCDAWMSALRRASPVGLAEAESWDVLANLSSSGSFHQGAGLRDSKRIACARSSPGARAPAVSQVPLSPSPTTGPRRGRRQGH